MTDPLRPFAQAIRSLWRTRAGEKSRSAGASSSAPGAAEPQAPKARVNETFQARLQARIAGLDSRDPKRLREAFVETVLLWEVGDQLAPDPALGDLVARVAEQLATDSAVSERLHQLLLQVSAHREHTPRD
jgi:hypothetical protein